MALYIVVTTEMVLSRSSSPLHSGIKSLIVALQDGKLQRSPEIFIDAGHETLFYVADPLGCELNQQRLGVRKVNRNGFLSDLAQRYSIEVAPWPSRMPPSPPSEAPFWTGT